MTSALARDPGFLTPGLGAEPAEPGRPLSHTHSQHLERDLSYPLLSPPPLLPSLAACPSLSRPSTRLPVESHNPPGLALEGTLEAMGMCRGVGVVPLHNSVEMATKSYTTTLLFRCPHHRARDSRHGQAALIGPF